MSLTTSWVFWALLSACFAALTAVLAKAGLQQVNPDFATFIRTGFILVFLSIFLTVMQQWENPAGLHRRTWVLLLLSGLATGASWLCYFRALKIGNAYQVAPVDKLSVVLVAVFAFAFLGERPAGRDWLGIALITAGVVVMVLKR